MTNKCGFALPSVLIASVVLLGVLSFIATSSSTIRTNLDDQYYNQLAQTAGDAGLAYAKACISANSGVVPWGADKSLRPDTDCFGNPLSSCPASTANALCHFVVLDGNIFTAFKVGYPASGSASDIISNGSTGLLRSSDATNNNFSNPWRQYSRSSHIDNALLSSISKILGTTNVGSVLTAGSVMPSGATVSYQWQRASSLGGVYTDISGATLNTYTLTADDLGKYIKVVAVGTGRYFGGSVASDPLTIAASCSATSTGATSIDSGLYRIYKYTTVGSFTFTPSSPCSVEVLVVAGGGGGGGAMGGGGGGGGLLYNNSMAIESRTYTVTVGSGGIGGSGSGFGANGNLSSFNDLFATGGGGGGYYSGIANIGKNGGSGGGGGGYLSGAGGTASPSGQGNNGGAGNSSYLAGGGGGASAAGQAGQTQVAGRGGDGLQYSISGTAIYYAGGGGGGGYYGITCTGGLGGLGGGGTGTCTSSGLGASGVANTGGGGGGAGYSSGVGGTGGSGIVIIKCLI